jgi:glycosyltransferase involved in cell wall biosynthesis
MALGAQRLVAVSKATRDYYVRRGVPASRIRVVHNAIDLSRFSQQQGARDAVRAELGLTPDEPVLISVAMLRPGKGVGSLLRALRLLVDRGFAGSLVLVGDGSERARLEATARDLELGDRVRFLGQRSDVPRLLSAADLYVLPSRAEAFPTVLMEAAACGLASVATRVGGVPEIIRHGENGLLVPVGDSKAMASAIQGLLAEPQRRARLAGRAGEDAGTYSPEAWGEALMSVYWELLPKGAARPMSVAARV